MMASVGWKGGALSRRIYTSLLMAFTCLEDSLRENCRKIDGCKSHQSHARETEAVSLCAFSLNEIKCIH